MSDTALLQNTFQAIAPTGDSDEIIRERMLTWELLRFCFGGATHPLPLGEHFTTGGVIRDCYRPTVQATVKHLGGAAPSTHMIAKITQVEALLI